MSKTLQITIPDEAHDELRAYQRALKSLTGKYKPLAEIASETVESGVFILKQKTRAINAKLEQIARLKISG